MKISEKEILGLSILIPIVALLVLQQPFLADRTYEDPLLNYISPEIAHYLNLAIVMITLLGLWFFLEDRRRDIILYVVTPALLLLVVPGIGIKESIGLILSLILIIGYEKVKDKRIVIGIGSILALSGLLFNWTTLDLSQKIDIIALSGITLFPLILTTKRSKKVLLGLFLLFLYPIEGIPILFYLSKGWRIKDSKETSLFVLGMLAILTITITNLHEKDWGQRVIEGLSIGILGAILSYVILSIYYKDMERYKDKIALGIIILGAAVFIFSYYTHFDVAPEELSKCLQKVNKEMPIFSSGYVNTISYYTKGKVIDITEEKDMKKIKGRIIIIPEKLHEKFLGKNAIFKVERVKKGANEIGVYASDGEYNAVFVVALDKKEIIEDGLLIYKGAKVGGIPLTKLYFLNPKGEVSTKDYIVYEDKGRIINEILKGKRIYSGEECMVIER